VDFFAEASAHYDAYALFQKKKMGKHPTAALCKKGKALLEVPKKDLMKAIAYLKDKKALTSEYEVIFRDMLENANKNLLSVKQNTDAINAYMKHMGYK
jgi:hypothetical protein